MARVSLTGRVFGIAQTCGEAAGRRGGEPGRDVFLVLLPGLAQVGVEIDEGREEQEPVALDDLGPVGAAQLVGRCAAPDAGDDAVLDDDVDHASSCRAGSTARTPTKRRRGGGEPMAAMGARSPSTGAPRRAPVRRQRGNQPGKETARRGQLAAEGNQETRARRRRERDDGRNGWQ